MGEPKLSDIVGGSRMLEGEEATRPSRLAGEGGQSTHVESAPAPAAETKPSAETTKSVKGEEPAAVKAEPTKKTSATPAQKTDAADDHEPDDSDPHPVPRKALLEERKKRQLLQKQLDELTGKLSVFEKYASQAQQPQAQPPSQQGKPTKDPDDEFFEVGPSGYIQKHLTATQEALRREMAEAAGQQKIMLSEELMRGVHPDFDEVVSDFVELAKTNPALRAQFNAQPNPAKFAYEYSTMHRKVRDIGSLEELQERIRTEERAKIEAEMRRESAHAEAAKISTSSAGARSAGTAPVRMGDVPLSEILAQR